MWKPSKRKPIYISDIKSQSERERTSLQNIVHGVLIVAVSMIIWYLFNACSVVPRAHMCEDKSNSIECAKWKHDHPKEYARYERQLARSPRHR